MIHFNGNGNNPYGVGGQNGVNGGSAKSNPQKDTETTQSAGLTLNSPSSDGFVRTTPRGARGTQQEGDKTTVENNETAKRSGLSKFFHKLKVILFGGPNWIDVDYNGEVGTIPGRNGGLFGRIGDWIKGLFS